MTSWGENQHMSDCIFFRTGTHVLNRILEYCRIPLNALYKARSSERSKRRGIVRWSAGSQADKRPYVTSPF